MDLLDIDANNLYGKAMSDPLPVRGFRWLTEEEIAVLDISSYDEHSRVGYIFEVDLDVPDAVHDRHNDYPLAPEKLTIDKTMLSPFQQQFPEEQQKTSQKLTPNLLPKKNYVTHYRNLQFYLKEGLELKRVHRVLTFIQEPWLARYIDFNTQMRAQSRSSFGKDFFKLMNNSVFGKTQECLRNRISVEVVTNRKAALKRVCKPSLKRTYTINKDLVVMEMMVQNLELNKPIYCGFSVLEISKLWMYQFHYEKMTQWFKNIELCFTDTDSLLYRIEGEDIYKIMKDHEDDFDFSDYPFNCTPKGSGQLRDTPLTFHEGKLHPKCFVNVTQVEAHPKQKLYPKRPPQPIFLLVLCRGAPQQGFWPPRYRLIPNTHPGDTEVHPISIGLHPGRMGCTPGDIWTPAGAVMKGEEVTGKY